MSKLGKTCSNFSKIVQTFPKLSKLFQNCPNSVKISQTWSYMVKLGETCPNLLKNGFFFRFHCTFGSGLRYSDATQLAEGPGEIYSGWPRLLSQREGKYPSCQANLDPIFLTTSLDRVVLFECLQSTLRADTVKTVLANLGLYEHT